MTQPRLQRTLFVVVMLGGAGWSVAAAQEAARRPVPAAAALELRSGNVLTAGEPNILAGPGRVFAPGVRYIVQLDGPMTPDRQRALEGAGARLGDAIPQNAYVATFEGTTPASLNALGFVVWAEEFRTVWKLDPELGAKRHSTAERRALDAAGRAKVVVTSFEGEDAGPIIDQIARLGGAVTDVGACGGQWLIDATLPVAQAAALAGLPAVQFIEDAPEGALRNDSNRWIVQSNVATQTPVWDKGIHGEGQIGGHIDGTIKEAHCMFDDAVPVGPAHRKLVALRNAGVLDLHGTHTAGSFAGDAPPYGVYTTNDGIAYAARLSFSNVDNIFASPSTLLARLNDAHADGARVHSNSWGDDSTTAYTTWCRQIDTFSYANEESLVAFAVSNGAAVTTPENALDVLAVAASQDTPNQGSFCYGGTGPTFDGRRKPEVYAPGCNTTSADANSDCGVASDGWSGTSMACPVVSGCGLLVRQYFTEGWYPSGTKNPADALTPSGALVKAMLINSAVNMTGIAGYPSNKEGWGRLKLNNTVVFAGDGRELFVADVRNASGLATGQSAAYTFTVNSSATPLNVTLVSTHPAASVNAANPVVNNLDLEVLAPAANLYKGNVFSSAQSAIGGNADAKNNVEQVIRSAPDLGVYTVTVKATAVNAGSGSPFRQGYALVVTGAITPCAAPSITDQPDPLSVRVDDPVSFTVGATGDGSLAYQWRRDSDPVGSDSPVYSIPSAQFSDAGTYSVTVTGSCGSAASAGAVLRVFCPADYNRDTFVTGQDFDEFTLDFESGDPAADFNRDTFVTGEDFDQFVAAFVAGC